MSAGGYSKYRYREELTPNFVNFTIYTETMYGPLLNTCARIEVNLISEYCEPNVMDIRHCAKIYLKGGGLKVRGGTMLTLREVDNMYISI